jgi:hypothetical protein
METIKLKSESMSFKGYKFKIWLKKNKETIKMLASAAIGVGVFFLPQIESAAASAAAASAATLISKLAADTVDFWISEVDLGVQINPETGKIVENNPPDPRPPPAPYNKV